jgi:hypothetical protein
MIESPENSKNEVLRTCFVTRRFSAHHHDYQNTRWQMRTSAIALPRRSGGEQEKYEWILWLKRSISSIPRGIEARIKHGFEGARKQIADRGENQPWLSTEA